MEKSRKTVRKKKEKPKESSEGTTLLFSQKDIRDFVLTFVTSWIKGDITIRFPTAAELSKSRPLDITFPSDPSLNAEVKIKEHYIDLLSICAGTKPASSDEQQKAIVEIFRMLLMFRSANRIEGRLQPSGLEERVDKLEKVAKSTNKMVEQITSYLFKEKPDKK